MHYAGRRVDVGGGAVSLETVSLTQFRDQLAGVKKLLTAASVYLSPPSEYFYFKLPVEAVAK